MPLPHRRPILRSLLILLALTAALVAVLAGPAVVRPASAAEPTVEAQLLSLTNAARAAAGAPALESSSAVVSVARRWSTAMAAQGTLSHNPDLGAQVSGWSRVAENVGVASSAEQVQQLFMGSAAHRANILDRRFDRVGIGVAEGTDGRLWFTVDLLQLAGSTAGAAPAPEPVPAPSARSSTPSPAAAARPAPRAAPRATPSEAPAPAARSQRAPAPASRSTPRSTPAAPAAPAPAAAALPDRDTAVAAAPSLARAAAPASDAGGTAATGPEDRAAIPLVLYAIPAFLGLLLLEWLSFRFRPDDAALGYRGRDTATSLSMGIGNVVINLAWGLVVVAAYVATYQLTPLRIPMDSWWAWALLLVADDLAYYWFHRVHHESRFFWASHVVHHSSQRYNLSTALRQTWTPMTSLPFWLPLLLVGFPPYAVLTMQAVSLLYQFWIHTERIHRLWAPLEWVLNTPSHHRVHHGSNRQYLDKNYGGILIVWDRLFGTFEPERERVRYGLTTNIATSNPVRVAFHEYVALGRDVRAGNSWRTRWHLAFGRPGWTPAVLDPGLSPAGR